MQLSILQTLPKILKKPRDISANANARPNACKVKMFVHCHAWNIGRLKYYAHIYLTMLSFARIGHVHLSCICIISFYHHYFVLHVVPAKTQHCIMWTLDSVS